MTAIAGAASTIASDALMNPFDGKPPKNVLYTFSFSVRHPDSYSDKAANANAQFRLPVTLALCEHCVSY